MHQIDTSCRCQLFTGHFLCGYSSGQITARKMSASRPSGAWMGRSFGAEGVGRSSCRWSVRHERCTRSGHSSCLQTENHDDSVPDGPLTSRQLSGARRFAPNDLGEPGRSSAEIGTRPLHQHREKHRAEEAGDENRAHRIGASSIQQLSRDIAAAIAGMMTEQST